MSEVRVSEFPIRSAPSKRTGPEEETPAGGVAAPMHPRESVRQRALDLLGVLDTPAEDRFDSIVDVAAELMGVPITAISLIDRDRQWFKASIGLGVSETPRSVAFCAHAVHDETTLVVSDALADTRFAKNPLVTGDPSIRSYAGVPISVEGSPPLGTLCVIDTVPRTFTRSQLGALAALAKQVESQLVMRETLRALAEANSSLDQYAGMVSHDLRAPVRGVRTLVEFLREDCGAVLDEVAQGHLDRIMERTQMMQLLMDDLLAYARAGTRSPGGAGVDASDMAAPAEVITSVLEEYESTPGWTSTMTMDPEASERTVERVPVALCLRNLIGNAIKHADDDGCHVAVDVRMESGSIVFSIADDGPGIAAENLSRIFEPFQRFQTNPDKQGSGVGLALVERTAAAHGGAIEVTSTLGAGSEFRLRWPVA